MIGISGLILPREAQKAQKGALRGILGYFFQPSMAFIV